MIQGAIFDMDGVLVDNLSYHVHAWQQFGREMGRDLAERDIRAVFGQRNREMVRKLLGPGLRDEDIPRLTERKEQIYRDCITPDLHPVPGLHDFLEQLKSAGIRSAVATSGPRVNVDFVLDRLAIRDYFDAIITGAEVTRSKPEPEIFLLAARQLGVEPEHCVVFEDSAAGIEAANRAGSICVALATTHSVEELRGQKVARIIPDFRSLTASNILG
jgi:beta-phosphoglucomutase